MKWFACGTARKAALSVYDADGSLRWEQALPVGGFDQSPLVVNGQVVYVTASGAVSACRVADGTNLARTNRPAEPADVGRSRHR